MVNAVELIQNVQLACLALIFGCMVLGHRTDRVLRFIWYAFLVMGVGAILDLSAPHLPRWLGYGLDYETAPVSYGLLNLAIATFVGRELWTRWVSVALVAVGLPFFLYWSGSGAYQTQSVAVIDFLMFVQTSCTAWVLVRSRERATASPRYTMAAFLLLFAAVGLYRSMAVALYHVSADQLLPSLEVVSASVYIVAVSILPLNLIWMVNARMRQELKVESHIDPLTNALNRRGFAEAAQRELARYGRGGQDFAVAIADVDHFKQLNDTHGHACGDEVLRQISSFFREELRQSDIASRSGGEEFTFMLPVTTTGEMFPVLDRLRLALERQTLTLEEDLRVKVTISIGVTNSAGRGHLQLDALQREADQALYAAKRAGRNRTVCFHELQSGAEARKVESTRLTTA